MKLKIKTKLLIGFSACLLLLLIVSGFMLYKFSESNEQLKLIVDSSTKKIEFSYRILEDVLETGILETKLISADNRNEALIVLNEKKTEISKIAVQLDTLVDDEGSEILSDFTTNWRKYRSKLEEDDLTERDYSNLIKWREAAVMHLEQLISKNKQEMQREYEASMASYNSAITSVIIVVFLSILVALIFSYWIITSINRRILDIAGKAERIASREHSQEKLEQTIDDELNPIVHSLVNISNSFREVALNANQIASGNYSLKTKPRSGNDVLGIALQDMAKSLKEGSEAREKHNWQTTGLNKLNERLMGNRDVQELCEQVIFFLAEYLKVQIGAIYLFDSESNILSLEGHYGYPAADKVKSEIKLKEGLIGQAAYDKKEILLQDYEEESKQISSASFNAFPKTILIIPFIFEERVLGVIELGKLSELEQQEIEFLDAAIENISLAVHSAIARKKVQELLKETQVQSEELQTQQEELRQMNEELEEQTQNLKQQQEELQMTNEELEEQTQALEAKNKVIEAAKVEVEQKTEQLEITSKYKSEFLANMSHELRTPLNSLLILSRDLAENKQNHLDEEEIESAEIIYKSGHDLLMLINEVLDLSRVEAGKMTLNVEKVRLTTIIDDLLKLFKYQAYQKGLELKSNLDKNLPEFLETDPQRLNQILKNLISNAIKFTEKGYVSLEVRRKGEDEVEFVVKDTGIGIKKEKQNTVFEAFQQADGGTARRYGGTGLGLSISREITRLLGGSISLESEPGQGSVFMIQIPIKSTAELIVAESKPLLIQDLQKKVMSKDFLDHPAIEDDRKQLQKEDKRVLIIEDDLQFSKILKKQAHEKNFKVIAASTGEDGLILAEKFKPDAIILDIDLPGMNGHQVLADVKANPRLRHIPVHMVSVDERTLDPIRQGAIEYLMKPIEKEDLDRAFSRIEDFVNRKMKNLLIVEDDQNSRKAIKKLIGNGDVQCLEAETGHQALQEMATRTIDCIVLDMGLPDMNGFDFIQELERIYEKVPPIIIYTGKELTKEENDVLEKYADSIIIKGVKSEERLLDETALFLHRTIQNLPDQKRQIINHLYDKQSIFNGKRILVVDDDMRNVFALSKVLKEKGMEVTKADNGVKAIEALKNNPNIDLVLMDIMMPEMDGYEAMQKIREEGKFRDLPIIALTAKAMRDDKQKCLDAGANDYITKPVDVPRLLSLMQVWLSS
ncbi:response regulator [Salinimicrobium catena]|uniref:response regulator n=1 Tax=Salinimicrobium catena TaxID=390640 RepID=UPI002FE49AF5